jgi:hypothetical protein
MESRRTRNIIVSCGVMLILTCVCLGMIVVSGVGVSLIWPIDFRQEDVILPTPIDEIVEPSAPTTPPEAPPYTEEPPIEADPLPEEIAEIVLEIEAQVSQIRGLTLSEPVPRRMISPEEIEDMVINEFFAEYTDEDARQDVLILSLLGLLPSDFDLKSFYNALYSEQISGFYDSETEEIFIVQGTSFGGSEKLTYAHEFTHALQDQTFRFDEGLDYNEEACQDDSERCAAIKALIEGDASLTEILWFQTYATRSDYKDIVETFENYASPILDNAPPYIQKDLYFPYEKGFAFVEFLFNEGGFEAVDAAYRYLPVSTEQILHPERYPWDQPRVVMLPNFEDVLDGDWILFDQNVMGEWYTYLILSQSYNETYRIPEEQASSAASGWGGDAYAIYLNQNTDEVIFILDMVWDTTDDADEFSMTLDKYANTRWDAADEQLSGQRTWRGQEGTVVFMQEGDRSLWIIAPTDALAEMILLELQ